ncbi:hypothetical protein F4820DRAFT_386451 [Hypoxylon rubiginosum]|uniref:Uncharacterized protein n=1 Tax=Hypoxylon rubiginosum TaxID=110542 RepID=A0ACB9YV92_9PEZI|nr:hypothetical protein F4820DRAFT_386451 [Hypoxylon rubiginosum]
MQTNAIIAALFAAATASGAVLKREATSFNVTGFSASCIPHSVLCVYGFNVITIPASASPSGNESPAVCQLMLQGPDLLPAVDPTGCANGGAYSWSVALQDGGLQLSVTTPQDSHGNYTGSYAITSDQLIIEQNGAVVDQRYTGPASFEVPIGAPSA